jgi:hypothetical protein
MTPPTAPEPRIVHLTTVPPFVLHITWQDGSRTSHDLTSLVATQPWAAVLRDQGVFHAAQLQDDGWQIVWPGTEAALSAHGLWDDVHTPPPAAKFMSAADFTAWLRERGWSFAQASEALGISKRMLKYYAAGTHDIPKTVWLACMHLAAQQSRRESAEDRARHTPNGRLRAT